MRNAAAELLRLISAVENGEREFIVGLVGYDDDEKVIACQTLDENGDGVRLIGADPNGNGNGAFSERLSSACGRGDCGL